MSIGYGITYFTWFIVVFLYRLSYYRISMETIRKTKKENTNSKSTGNNARI